MKNHVTAVYDQEEIVRVFRAFAHAKLLATQSKVQNVRGLFFEPDMLKYCARRCRVQAEVKQIIDIVSGEMLTMKTPAYMLQDVHFSGERQHFNAQYEPLFWRAIWLRRV